MRLSIRPGCHVSQAVESNASVTAPATERLVSLAIFGLLESARGITSIFARRIVFELLGWLLHILIDIPTHSFSYYATRLLWPVSDYRIDGIALWTPWFWAATYGALGVAWFLLWKRGAYRQRGTSEPNSPKRGVVLPDKSACGQLVITSPPTPGDASDPPKLGRQGLTHWFGTSERAACFCSSVLSFEFVVTELALERVRLANWKRPRALWCCGRHVCAIPLAYSRAFGGERDCAQQGRSEHSQRDSHVRLYG